jgi:hypothetical protein
MGQARRRTTQVCFLLALGGVLVTGKPQIDPAPVRSGAKAWRAAGDRRTRSPYETGGSHAAGSDLRFPSSGYAGISPADAGLAVGRADIVETTNSQITIWTKTGQMESSQNFTSFFPQSGFCIDPRPIYWSWDDRFAVVCSDNAVEPNSSGIHHAIWLAVSASGDPKGAWYRYQIGGLTDPNNGYDQPAVVATKDKLVIVAYYCPPPDPGDGTCSGDQFFVLALRELLRGAPDPRVVHLTSDGYALNKPAVEVTPTSSAYFVNLFAKKKSSTGSIKSTRHVQLTVISGSPISKRHRSGRVSMHVKDLGDNVWKRPPDVPLPGGSAGSMELPPDGRAHNAVYEVQTSDGKPVIEFGASAECGGRVCNANGRILMDGTPRLAYQKTAGQSGYDYTFGSVGLDAYGHYFISFSRSSKTQAPQAILSSTAFSQVIYDAGMEAVACISSGECSERWGDYLGIAQDPVDPSHVWAVGEYQAQTGKWGTVIAEATVNGTL